MLSVASRSGRVIHCPRVKNVMWSDSLGCHSDPMSLTSAGHFQSMRLFREFKSKRKKVKKKNKKSEKEEMSDDKGQYSIYRDYFASRAAFHQSDLAPYVLNVDSETTSTKNTTSDTPADSSQAGTKSSSESESSSKPEESKPNLGFLDSTIGLHMKFCGHSIHLKCLHNYVLAHLRDSDQSSFAALCFECPICRTVCNTFVPFVPPHSVTRLYCPRHDSAEQSEELPCNCSEDRGEDRTLNLNNLPKGVESSVIHLSHILKMIQSDADLIDDTIPPLSRG